MVSRTSNLTCKMTIQIITFLLAIVTTISSITSALPFPAPDLQNCKSTENCCPPILDDTHEPPTQFQFQTLVPLRIRPAANLVDTAYSTKLQKAYELMRALPDSDGRSLKNQAKLHCAYCDNNFYFEGKEYPLEIHQNWLFLPWHRMFVYFHERILARLLEEDEFALPFWYWDDTSVGLGFGNLVPEVYDGYGDNKSSLVDLERNKCAQRPNVVDLVNPFVGCAANKTPDQLRTENAHVIYTHMVTGGVTPSLFFGMPYRFGDKGGVGGGTLEVKPHAPVHVWVNLVKMLTTQHSAQDPIFFAHHANVDRLWTIWKRLPGGVREDLRDPDWLDTKFTYYDEWGRLVVASVAQSLDIDKLRYKYEEVPTPWATGAVNPNDTNPEPWPSCYNNSTTDIQTMINTTKPFRSPLPFQSDPITFRVKRKPAENRWSSEREEVLQLKGRMNWTLPMIFNAFLNLLGATTANTSLQGCPEYLGSFVASPHVGSSLRVPGRLKWRVALRQKLEDLGTEGLAEVAITLAGPLFPNKQTINITSAKIFHINE